METKEELQQIIKNLKSKLDETIKKLKNFDMFGKWTPQGGETYYYIDSNVRLNSGHCYQDDSYNPFLAMKIKNFNCFKTQEEAQKRIQKYLIESKIEWIANRLNEGREIDWSDSTQKKYYIYFNKFDFGKDFASLKLNKISSIETYGNVTISVRYETRNKIQGCIYCLDNSFLDAVKREIPIEDLLHYMKG